MADCLPKNLSFKITLLSLAVGFFSVLCQATTFADVPDWLSKEVAAQTVRDPLENTPRAPGHTQQCRWQKILTVADSLVPINSCVFQAKSFRIAYSTDCLLANVGCQSQSMIYISVGSDVKFYQVPAFYALQGSHHWYVTPESNRIVFEGNGMVWVIDDVISLLKPGPYPGSYDVQQEGIRIFGSVLAKDVQISNAAVSANGEWLAGSLVNFGLVRMHLPDGVFTWFSDETLPPSGSRYELSVTNDGKFVAAGGLNNNPKIYRIDDNCGKTTGTFWSDPAELNAVDDFINCPSKSLVVMIQNAAGIDHVDMQVQNVRYPNFEGAGDSLTLLEKYNLSSERWLKLKGPGYVASRLEYLAMGDSISSGEGDVETNPITNGKYYRVGTDVPGDHDSGRQSEKCHVSTRSYPYILASSMNLSMEAPIEWGSVACSGARSFDISMSGDDVYDGQGHRLQGYANISEMQMYALSNFIPGRVEQVKFIQKYKPKAITITVGANDVAFGDKLRDCIMDTATCSWASDKMPVLASQIKGEFRKLVALFEDIKETADASTKIYVLGYPYLMFDEPGSHCGLNVGALNLAERKTFTNATAYMNTVIQWAASEVGVQYIDISAALVGGRVCEGWTSYVNGVSPTDLQQSFHPNSKGHDKIASKILESLNGENLLTYSGYLSSLLNVVSAPDIPYNLGGETDLNSENRRIVDDSIVKGSSVSANIEPITFQPNSIVQFTLHSDPVDLGGYLTDSDGGLTHEITIPQNIEPGYHTLSLEGKTFSGEPLEITQTVLVISSNPSDRDENGVKDDEEICGPFWTDILGDEAAKMCTVSISSSVNTGKASSLASIGEKSMQDYKLPLDSVAVKGLEDTKNTQNTSNHFAALPNRNGKAHLKEASEDKTKKDKGLALYMVFLATCIILAIVSYWWKHTKKGSKYVKS